MKGSVSAELYGRWWLLPPAAIPLLLPPNHLLGTMDTSSIKEAIVRNAEEIERLHRSVHDTFELRNRSPEHKARWQTACSEFRARYDKLAFPEGLNGAYERILSGDPLATEAGLCFLEIRPYFFRSGYIYKDLVRKLKRADLSKQQQIRFESFLQRLAEWKSSKQSSA